MYFAPPNLKTAILSRTWRRRCAAQTRKFRACKSRRSLRTKSERELLLIQVHKENFNTSNQQHCLVLASLPILSHQVQSTDSRWNNTELCRGQKISQPQLRKKKSQAMVHQQSVRCCQPLIPSLCRVLQNLNLHLVFLQ